MEDIDLRQILHILWQGHNKIMGFICTFLILAVIYLIFAPQVYESNSSMTIQSSDIVNTEKDQNYIGIYAEIIKDPRMLGIDKDEYDKIVKVLVPRQTRIIQLIVSGKDAKEACSKSIMGPLSRPRSKILRVAVSRIILSSEASKVKLVGNLVA